MVAYRVIDDTLEWTGTAREMFFGFLIVIALKPAIAETEPDALAGVLAHEIAHVRRRHVTEALLRELCIGALIRMLAGNLGANAGADRVLELHSRQRGTGR